MMNIFHYKSFIKRCFEVILVFFIIQFCFLALQRFYSSKSTVQVAVLGSYSPIGRFLTLMLKQNQIVSDLKIFGENAEALAFDLNFIDTKCKAQSYNFEDGNIKNTIRGADIVVLLGEALTNPHMSINEFVQAEGDRVAQYAKSCSEYAPKSIIIVAVKPVSVCMPIVEEVFKKTSWYNPSRIIGSAGFAEIKSTVLASKNTHMDPQLVNVPLIGGPDIDTCVPLFSRATPASIPQTNELTAKFRGVRVAEFPKKMKRDDFFEISSVGEAMGLNRLITRVAMGLCGDAKSCGCGFVRTNLVESCKHLVTTLQFGKTGVIHNFGIPELNRTEMKLLTKAMLDIKNRENMAKDFVKFSESDDDDCDEPDFSKKQAMIEAALKKKIIKPLILD